MYPIILDAQPAAWRLFTARKKDKAFIKFRDRVFERDAHTCQFCGFVAKEYQEVVNIDHNYLNNQTSNMATACVLCTQCFFLDMAGVGDFGGGTLIYLPEVSQASLNSFCHVMFCAISSNSLYNSSAAEIYRSLKLRSQQVDAQFGEGASKPSIMGQMLIEVRASSAQMAAILQNIRLLPARDRFKEQIERWMNLAFEENAQADAKKAAMKEAKD